MDALEEFVQESQTLTRQVKDFCKTYEVHMEQEHHDHKFIQEGLKKVMDLLTKQVRFAIEAYSKVNRGVGVELYMLYELVNYGDRQGYNPGSRVVNEKVQAAKEDISKHVKNVGACVGVFEHEVKKNEEFLHKKLPMDQKHMDMDYEEVVVRMRRFAEYIEDSFKMFLKSELVFIKAQKNHLKEIPVLKTEE